MDPIIRAAVPGDAQTIAQFQMEMALETENKTLDCDIVLNAVQSVFSDPSKGFYLIAEIDNRVVGSLMVTYEWSDWRNCNMWYLQSVFVQPGHRGRGIFKHLFNEVIGRARMAGALYVRLYVETENVRAQKIYESLGMKRMPYYMYDKKVT